MPSPDPCLLSAKLLRLASIAVQYEDESDYGEAVRLYHLQLGLPGCPAPGAALEPFYSFPVGAGAEIEFRVELDKTLANKKNRTVIYWEVANDIPAFDALYGELTKLKGFSGKKKRHKTPNMSLIGDSQRSLIEDASGNLFGQIINPPWPLSGPAPKRGLSKTLCLLAGVAAGALLGPLLSKNNRRP